jgi:hypothetical protein
MLGDFQDAKPYDSEYDSEEKEKPVACVQAILVSCWSSWYSRPASWESSHVDVKLPLDWESSNQRHGKVLYVLDQLHGKVLYVLDQFHGKVLM